MGTFNLHHVVSNRVVYALGNEKGKMIGMIVGFVHWFVAIGPAHRCLIRNKQGLLIIFVPNTLGMGAELASKQDVKNYEIRHNFFVSAQLSESLTMQLCF